MGYIVLIVLLLIFSWLVTKDILKTELNKSTLLFCWLAKLLSSISFILIFTFYFGEGKIYGDVQNFMNDSRVINDYAVKEPIEYLKLLFGAQGDETSLMQTHLSNTNIWSAGENGDFLNDNRLIIRINSIIHFFSFNNIWVHAIIFAFASFIGTLLIYRSFVDYIKHKSAYLFSLFLLPTVAFWGSSPSKEGLMILSIGLFFYSIQGLLKKRRFSTILLLIISIFILIFNKPYVGIIIIPLSILLIIGIKTGISLKKGILLSVILILFTIVSALIPGKLNTVDRISYKQQDLINLGQGGVFFITDSSFCAFDYKHVDHFNYDPETRLITVQENTDGEYKLFGQTEFNPFTIAPSNKNYEVYHIIEPSNSFIDVTPVNHSFVQVVKNIPSAIFNVLVRPLPWDPGDSLKVFGFIENIVIICWFIFVGFNRRSDLSNSEKSWVFYFSIVSISLILLIGLTVPILGAIARYKIAPSLFLLILSFILFERKPKQL